MSTPTKLTRLRAGLTPEHQDERAPEPEKVLERVSSLIKGAGEDGLVKLWQPRNYKGNDFVFEEDILPLHHRDVELASSASPRATCMELGAPH